MTIRKQLTSDVAIAREMLPALGDVYQRDQTILFIRQSESLLRQEEISSEDVAVLREHY